MTIKDFKIESDLIIDGILIDLSYSTNSGGIYFDASSNSYKSGDSNIPVGVVRMWASGSTSPTIPDDYLICDGRQNLSQTEYARLYAVIGNRFTSSPNGATFGIPSFNSSSKQYPAVIGINKTNDNATSGIFTQTANQNTVDIGSSSSTSHSHTSGSNFNPNTTTDVSLSHTHNTGEGTENHSHNWTTGTTGGTSHNHNAGNASAAHAHGYSLGDQNYLASSNPTGGHSHTYTAESETHGHSTSTNGHTHNVNGPTGQNANENTHNHAFTSSLSPSAISHTHQVDTSGFYFIIRYR